MSAMVQIFSCGERWNVPFNEAKKKVLIAETKHFTSRASNSKREVLRGRLRHA